MRGTGPFATLRINLFWQQHVGLDHPCPPPFSQEKGERERNVGSRNSLLALETLSLHLGISKQTPEVKTLYACIFFFRISFNNYLRETNSV